MGKCSKYKFAVQVIHSECSMTKLCDRIQGIFKSTVIARFNAQQGGTLEPNAFELYSLVSFGIKMTSCCKQTDSSHLKRWEPWEPNCPQVGRVGRLTCQKRIYVKL